MNSIKRSPALRLAYRFAAQISDPLKVWRGGRGFGWYWADYLAYRKMPGAEPLRFTDLEPALHERRAAHEFDAHYYYVNAWAFRKVLANAPSRHVDVASQTVFSSLLSAVLPVTYIDIRPLAANLAGLECAAGNLLELPYSKGALNSVSCLHVAEHVGLGRYGDALDPEGTKKACAELNRVLAPQGNLYFAVPIGRPRVCFNAHRIHSAESICEYFNGLELVEYSGVHDGGQFVENVGLAEFRESNYACGMFWFRKPN